MENLEKEGNKELVSYIFNVKVWKSLINFINEVAKSVASLYKTLT